VKFDDVERFVLAQKQRGVSNKTVWNLVVDVRALFNWAMKKGLVRTNPVNKADLSAVKNRKPKKAALDLNDIDFVAALLDGYDRVYFDYMRYTGSRMDEANRARWEDIDLDRGWVQVQGTKTEESAEIIPLAPVLREQLVRHREKYPDVELIFPGRSYQTKDRKIYSRRRFFEKIQRLTAKAR
jgi:integrase